MVVQVVQRVISAPISQLQLCNWGKGGCIVLSCFMLWYFLPGAFHTVYFFSDGFDATNRNYIEQSEWGGWGEGVQVELRLVPSESISLITCQVSLDRGRSISWRGGYCKLVVFSWLFEGIRKLKSVCHQYSLGTRCVGDNLCKSLVLVQYSFGHGVRGWRAQLFSSLDSLLYVRLSLCLLVLLLVI